MRRNVDLNKEGQCIYCTLNKCFPGVLLLENVNEQIDEYFKERRKWDKSFEKSLQESQM